MLGGWWVVFLFSLQYSMIEELAIGPYFYPTHNNTLAPLTFCVVAYSSGVIWGFNESYTFNSASLTTCHTIPPKDISPSNDPLGKGPPFSSEAWLAENNASLSFDSLLEATLSFTLKTVRFRDLGPFKSPDCFQFDIQVGQPGSMTPPRVNDPNQPF